VCNVDRQQFNERLLKLQAATDEERPVESTKKVEKTAKEPKPIEIKSECKIRGKKQYGVHYTDNKVYLCD